MQLGCELHVFASEVSPGGALPRFPHCMQVAGAETGDIRDKLELELACSEDLPGFASADQTDESEQPKHEPSCWHGGKGWWAPLGDGWHGCAGGGWVHNPVRGWRQSRGAGEALGKKLYTVEEIIFHLPAGQLVLSRVFSVWDLRICRQTNSITQQRSV